MKSALREYGLIIALIVISISGYLLFAQNKEDFLAYSLDVLGNKLVNLIDDESSKMKVAAAFDRFEQQVLNNEIAPEQVEFVVANVLNLSNSGARLSPEEAEMVFTLSAIDEPVLGLPSPEAPSIPPSPQAGREFAEGRAQMGDNIRSMIQFADQIASRDSIAVNMVRFETDSHGLHVIVDPNLERHFRPESFAVMKNMLNEKKLVKWEKEVDKDMERTERWFKRQEQRIALVESTEVQNEERSERIQTLGRISRLQSLGVRLAADSTAISREIELIVAETMAEVGAIMSSSGMNIRTRPDSLARRKN